MSSALILCVTFASVLYVASGCKCVDRTNEVKYCDSDFVTQINVLRSREVPANLSEVGGEILYTVKILQTFHSTPKYNNTVMKRQLTTPTHTCGVKLEPKQIYLVAGKVNADSGLTLHKCSWNQKWDQVTSTDKAKLADGSFERKC